ncbi:MAG: phytase [Planctomycetaceae bacterium]|nr:phytase [Planctomycetaceae bacterium]
MTARHVLASSLLIATVSLALMAQGQPPAPATQPAKAAGGPVKPLMTLKGAGVYDQDDMCFWRDPKDASKSLIITSDKYANKVFVYDLEGKLLQTLDAPFPGNIDTRYGFPLGGEKVDIVVHNQRQNKNFKLRVYKVDPQKRQLVRIDNENINTGDNYGGTLYHSGKTGKFYFFTTSKKSTVEQHELFDDGKGKVAGKHVRSMRAGFSEGAVADDAAGTVFVASERHGIIAFQAEPDAPKEGKMIATAKQYGIRPDLEGMTIFPTSDTDGYLIASSQGNNTFKVFDRKPPYAYVGTFTVAGVTETDGIDCIAGDFGPRFPKGIFICHTGADRKICPNMLVSWTDVLKALGR